MTEGRHESTDGPIVVGVDGSEASKHALRWAGQQSHMTGTPLHALMAWRIPANAYGLSAPLPDSYDFGPDAQRILDEAVRDVLGEHPSAEISVGVVEGFPAVALLQAASTASLLVVGSRGHGAFAGMLLGSVSAHCVAHAPCPVVVVPHGSRSDEVPG